MINVKEEVRLKLLQQILQIEVKMAEGNSVE